MEIIINGKRGRECKNLEKFWVITKEKLERSDHDVELSFNRLHFIAQSKVGLASAAVIDNVLFYLSVMYKACYHSVCVLQVYDVFIQKILRADYEKMPEVTMTQWYYQAFQEGNVTQPVSDELVVRFSEMLAFHPEKAILLRAFFSDNNIVLLKLIACLNHFSIGYQVGDETKRRAYLFSKLLCLVRESLHRQIDRPVSEAQTVVNLERVNINSIMPNLKSKIDLFDFGICFRSGKVILHEFVSPKEGMYSKINGERVLWGRASVPDELWVTVGDRDLNVSLRSLFDRCRVYAPREQHVLPLAMDSQVYLASGGGSAVWRLVKKCVKYAKDK